MIVEISKKYIFHKLYNGKDDIFGVTEFKQDNNKEPVGNCLVSLFHQKKNLLVHSLTSNENGEYLFKDIDLKNNTFFIVAHHPTKSFNGVIADNIGGENVDD